MIANLIATLVEEDLAEDDGVLAPDDRLTCHVHGRWIHQCVSSPVHVNPVTRYRHRRATGFWCRDCDAELGVVVDELSGEVAMRCPRCGRGGSAATARLIAACRASIEARRAA
ncbi:hypothetical protein [Lentzea nigeriaca]|uniref:hypothetical protein n=1 Tax=Lentzea nigeriaca TaxID=1128665 RepID=UPI00195AE147|nr:hypothetical protein [Lentzea nigeriaca]MBM7863282.1 DNA-directed RNA polymerase subunit RPC12/RpoP [Lentzea nigeriaca]